MTTSQRPAPVVWKSDVRARPSDQVDAVVIGAGHHGLVAATVLADAGWDVLVLEARDVVGGAVASVSRDRWVLDEFSACHPLAVASPVLRGLELETHGLAWAHAARPLAHAVEDSDGTGAAIEAEAWRTAAALDQDAQGDGAQWLRLVEHYRSIKGPLLDALLTQWPPTTSAARLLRAIGPTQALDFARFALLPVDRMGVELFRGTRGRDLLAGNAMHADIPPQAPGSGLFGWLMSMLAQDVGFPSPQGGTAMLATALAARAAAAGAEIRTGTRVQQVLVESGRAVGVVTAGGARVRARRAVIADASGPALYDRLLPDAAVPAGLRTRLRRFDWDLPTVKLNYCLSGPMPWRAERAHGAGVVHAGLPGAALGRWSADLDSGRVPAHPFALVGQMTTIDPSRSPAGTEALWLYTHAPRRRVDGDTARLVVERAETMLDGLAPGWRDLVRDRWDQFPQQLESADENLGDGAVGGGTMQLFQQAFWRPVTGLGGPGTHLEGLFLASAAVHPGGGVHGGAGFVAARAALREQAWWGRPLRRLRLASLHRLYAEPPAVG